MGGLEPHVNFLKWYLNQLGVNIGNERYPINIGLPQGAKNSPFNWLVLFNDLLVMLDSIVEQPTDIMCYADDLLVVCTSHSMAITVQRAIDTWASENYLRINYKKNKTAMVEVLHHQRKHGEYNMPIKIEM